jgi:L-threonylcarbamoyladenylate synthase
MLNKKIVKDSIVNMETVLNLLENGELLALPTETVYALSCDPTNKKSIEKIFSLKNRDNKKPLSLLCSSIEMIKKFAELTELEIKILQRFAPGPITLVVKLKNDHYFASNFNSNRANVGVRIPLNKFLIELINKFNKPIIGTSLNISGESPLITSSDIYKNFAEDLSIIVESTETNYAQVSTVIEIKDNKLNILRPGFISAETIQNFIELNI